MALPTLDAVFASAADLPRRMMLAQWLVNIQYSGSVVDCVTLPEQYLWAKIAVATGAPRSEADYISLPKNYVWKAIYDAVSGTGAGLIQWNERQALGHIAAAYREDTANPANLATYINWPWRYQVASIITNTAVDTDAQTFITTSGATDIEGIDQFVKEVKLLGLWNSMVAWPLRSSQNAGTGATAYSLGGLGAYNGTLFNSPSWTISGINFDGVNDYINTSIEPSNYADGLSELIVFNAPSDAGNFAMFFGDEDWTVNDTTAHKCMIRRQSTNNVIQINSNFGGNPETTSSQNITFGQWNMVHARVVAPSNFISVNSAEETSNTGSGSFSTSAPNNDRIGFGAREKLGTPNLFAKMTASFGAFWANGTSASQMQSIKAIYKQTLGAGLTLP
jgi:hypothetical protein